MQLTIIKKNKLTLFTLPEVISGNHWIKDFENGRMINLINVEATPDGWNIVGNGDAFVVDNNDIMVPNVLLKDYNFYVLKNNYKNEKYYLYCSPVYDPTYKELGINGKITVGLEKSNDICYKLGGIPKKAFQIEKKDRYYYLTILDNNASVYVNQKRILKNKRLEYGDIIFTFGLKIILLRKDGRDFLLVNNPAGLLEFNANFVNVVKSQNEFIEDNTELSENVMYTEDYFYRAPRFYKALKEYELEIDPPPSKKEKDKTPMLLTIGPMATMAMTSVVMLMTNLASISSGEKDLKSSMGSIVMSIAMLASSLLWPLLTKLYQKFSDKMYERKRQKLYRKYIDKKELEIISEMEIQRKSLLENHFTVTDCQNIIKGHNIKLWQRRITDEDFLSIPMGFGNMPMQITLKYPEEHFSMTTDDLLDIVYELGRKERTLKDVPITFSFNENRTVGIVGDSIVTKDFIDRIILQMVTNYSYDELKIVTFTSNDNEKDWDYVKTLPHSWSNDKGVRYFGSSNDDYREIVYVLEKIYNERNVLDENVKYIPHYVIVTDAIKSIDSYDFIKQIMTTEKNVGFSLIMLVDKLSALPNECQSFINVNPNECEIFSRVINKESQKFKIDYSSIDEIYNCAQELANIPINMKDTVETSLPDVYQFLEMYQVGKIEQLNLEDRWKKSNPILTLQAPIGIGKNGEVITLDLHEKSHGPHGLVAGTTGSGKSEFLITYILSLAVNYHPYEVQMILIDYKGGSLAGAFSNDTYVLPHLAGTITNLDGSELNRSLVSIESEVKRRQREFNEAKRISNESTIDIYKYQRLWREGKLNGMEPIAHLFIISDEFAELKEQQPEFMDKLISVARVGRSLGIHLILATQKPGGVVNDQIWSNTRFRVCLKVQDTGDSQEVLKKPDAAFLKKTGRFYLQVGYDEVFTLGQSAWAGGQYYPSSTFKRDVDTSVNAVNNIGAIYLSKDVDPVEKVKSAGEELPNVVKYLYDVARKEDIKIRKLWLEKISSNIYIDHLKEKYHFERKAFYLNPIIGEYDDPANQNQFALTLPLSKLGNAIVYGVAGSGKEQFITSFIYSCMTSYSAEEVNFYIMDFGSEILKVFVESPYVGDIAFVNDEDKVKNLLKMISKEIDRRKDIFSNYGGTYQSYMTANVGKMPNIVVVVNNLETFSENYENFIDPLNQLLGDAFKYGIYFVATARSENSIRYKMKQNFALVYALAQNTEADYYNILGNCRGKIPTNYKGRGLFKRDEIYEFQTAKVKEENENGYIIEFCKMAAKQISYRPKRVPVLPKVVDYLSIKDDLTNTANLVIGINQKTLLSEKYNFSKNAINIISSYEVENTMNFVNALVNETMYLNVYDITFINGTEITIDNSKLEGRIYNKNYDTIINKIFGRIESVYEAYEKSNFNDEILGKEKKAMVIIYGVSNFINKLSDENRRRFGEIVRKDNQLGLVSFVLVDSADSIKAYVYEDWFKNGSDLARGIWVGNGITDQMLFRIAKFDREDRDEITNEYGYIIQNSKLYKVKLLASFTVE